MGMDALMQRYEAIADASAAMAGAARAGNWEALVAAQQHCATLVQQARLLPALNLNSQQRRAWYNIIRKVLEEDAEVRRFTECRMAELDRELRGFRANRDLDKAYR